MPTPLELIISASREFQARVEHASETEALFDLALLLSDGRTVPYKIVVSVRGLNVSAKESVPQRLPAFCPELHINGDGSFCLYWAGYKSMEVVDLGIAVEWWGLLWKYLTLQERAKKLRKWPNTAEWAHGKAVTHQYMAIKASEGLGEKFSKALDESRLSVTWHRGSCFSQGPTLRLLLDGVPQYSVWTEINRVVNRKQRCFCGVSGLRRPKRLRTCGSHSLHAANLALALHRWAEEDKLFWKNISILTCCGTCDSCPLKK
jgi:hypothetical protein